MNGHADVTALLDATTGDIKATYYYDAFGTIVEETSGTLPEGEKIDNPFRYSGYQYDEETEFYYLNARMYDSKIARFMQEDTYRGKANDPLSLNLYTYCTNNPLIYYDPTGHVVMKTGSRGDAVISIQEQLTDLGFNTGGNDGIFGKNTQAAVIKFQKAYGLQVDGVVGNQTLTMMKRVAEAKSSAAHGQMANLASASSIPVGQIKDNTILMSKTTFDNTVKQIQTKREESGGGTVLTKVEDNKVIITGVVAPTPKPEPAKTTTSSVNVQAKKGTNEVSSNKSTVTIVESTSAKSDNIKSTLSTIGKRTVSTGLGAVPVLGDAKDISEAIKGKDVITGEKLTVSDRIVSGLYMLMPIISGRMARDLGDAGEDAIKGIAKAINNATEGMRKGSDDLVNVASDFRTNHILFGDKTGGGHLWPGSSGKSVFPEAWDADTVMYNISDIATDPNIAWQKGRVVNGIQRYEVIGIRDGVKIKVITDGKDIITAFPIDK